MLVAINENNMRVYANEAKKVDEYGNKIKYYCPHCHSELILKQGSIKISHFSHKSKSDCPFQHEGESYTHELMKNAVKKIIERDVDYLISELEYPIGNRIADYYFEINKNGKIYKIAIECVHKHTNIDDFRSKNVDYANMGIYVIWVFSYGIFKGLTEKRINAILKEAHILGFDTIFTIDEENVRFYLVHFNDVKRFVTYTDDGIYYYKILKATKRCIIGNFSISNCSFSSCTLSRDSQYMHKNKLYYDAKVVYAKMGTWWELRTRASEPFNYDSYSFVPHEGDIIIYNRYDSTLLGEIYSVDFISDIYRALDEIEDVLSRKLSFAFKFRIFKWYFNIDEYDYDCLDFVQYYKERKCKKCILLS